MKWIRKIWALCCLGFVWINPIPAQNNAPNKPLDSLNLLREKDRGVFKLYIKKPEFECITGFYRNRETATQGFEPINFTYHVYLPFQFDLSYLNRPAGDKLLILNTTLIVHHSKFGNYALGLGQRFSFLTFKHAYLSYQGGLVWCEPVKRNTNDGINTMGFCLHHEFSFSYWLSRHWKISANVVHLSSGNLFKSVKNNQDVIGIGVSYAK